MIFIIAYVFICVLIGLLGVGRPLGFLGNFLGALLLTPLIWLLLLAFAERVNQTPERYLVKAATAEPKPDEVRSGP